MGRSDEGRSGGSEKDGKNPRARLVGGIFAVFVALLCAVSGISGALPGAGQGTADSSIPVAEQTNSSSETHLTFRSEEKLQSHFEKHGAQMGYSTAEDYLAGANAVVADPGSLHKTQVADGDDAYYREATGEFVVVSSKGYIRTYFIASREYWDKQ